MAASKCDQCGTRLYDGACSLESAGVGGEDIFAGNDVAGIKAA
jgi:hypothetical protein